MKPEIRSYSTICSDHHIWELRVPLIYLATQKNVRWKILKWIFFLMCKMMKDLWIEQKGKKK